MAHLRITAFLACVAAVCLADSILPDLDFIASQSTSLLQVGAFHKDGVSEQENRSIEGNDEKATSFSSEPLSEDSWGFDEDADDEDAENDSEDMLDGDTDSEGDADTEGISELQISSDRASHHIQYAQPRPAVVQSPGSVSVDHEIPGTLRQAVVQSIQQPASHPTAGLVSTSSAETEQTSRAAFSQLSALEAEFKELREDDSSHVKQLMYTVHLREKLRDQLQAAFVQLEKDNQQLAEQTAQIIMTGDTGNAAGENQQAQSEGQQTDDADLANSTVAAALLQAAISSRQHRELTGQQIAAEALNHVSSLMNDIAALRNRDEQEMQTLRKNVDSREALRVKIESRRAQLQTDAGALMEDLSKIRGLVEHESEVQNNQAAQPSADVQDGPKVDQAQASGQQPQEQVNMLQQQVVQQPQRVQGQQQQQ